MSAGLIALCGVLYLGVFIDQLLRGNLAMAAVYFGYAFANVGLYYLAK